MRTKIRDHLRTYLRGELDLATLEEWFIPATWSVDVRDGSAIANVVNIVTVALDACMDGEISESVFRSRISNAFSEVNVSAD